MIYLIHDSSRLDRELLYRKELDSQGIESWELVPAVKGNKTNHTNIAQAHKECIRRAIKKNLPQVVIMEDDVMFACPGAYNRFIELSRVLRQDMVDVFVSGGYEYYWADPPGDANMGRLKRFSGLHCYLVNKRFYQRFLDMPEKINIDKQLTDSGAVVMMAWPMLALQHTTKSDNTGITRDYNNIYRKNIKLWQCK